MKYNCIKHDYDFFMLVVGNYKDDKKYGHVGIILMFSKKFVFLIIARTNLNLVKTNPWYHAASCEIRM